MTVVTLAADPDSAMGLGLPPELANIMSQSPFNVTTGLVAAGTTVTDALQLAGTVNIVATTAASTGVKLWIPSRVGTMIVVKNNGAADLKVYPPNSSGQINAITAGSGTTLTTAGKQIGVYWYIAANTWIGFTVSAAT